MLPGLEQCIGLKIRDEVIEEWGHPSKAYAGELYTRPDYYESGNIHINMRVSYDDEHRVCDVDGDKCYSYCGGMWNRSHKVFPREFSKKDIAYLKRYIKTITE